MVQLRAVSAFGLRQRASNCPDIAETYTKVPIWSVMVSPLVSKHPTRPPAIAQEHEVNKHAAVIIKRFDESNVHPCVASHPPCRAKIHVLHVQNGLLLAQIYASI